MGAVRMRSTAPPTSGWRTTEPRPAASPCPGLANRLAKPPAPPRRAPAQRPAPDGGTVAAAGAGSGASGAFEALYYLLEDAFIGERLNPAFLYQVQAMQPFNTNPVFAILHELIYCEGKRQQLGGRAGEKGSFLPWPGRRQRFRLHRRDDLPLDVRGSAELIP